VNVDVLKPDERGAWTGTVQQMHVVYSMTILCDGLEGRARAMVYFVPMSRYVERSRVCRVFDWIAIISSREVKC
jgi:hypothetical protein